MVRSLATLHLAATNHSWWPSNAQVADRQALARRQEKAGNIAIVNTRLRTELTGYQQQLEELRQTHPDSVMDVSSEVYQTVAKLQRKIKEQEKEIARVNAAEDKRRQNMQNSTSFQGWKEINDRARADNNTQDIAYAQLKKEAGAEAVSFEDNIFARRKTVPQMLWKTEKPQVTMHASLEECCAMSDTRAPSFFCQTRNPSRMKPRTVTAPNLTAATRRPTIRIDPRSAWIL